MSEYKKWAMLKATLLTLFVRNHLQLLFVSRYSKKGNIILLLLWSVSDYGK